jgi:NTE family protein
MRDMATIPDGVEAHVLPAGGTSKRDDSLRAHRDFGGVQARIDATYDVSRAFLDDVLGPAPRPLP